MHARKASLFYSCQKEETRLYKTGACISFHAYYNAAAASKSSAQRLKKREE